MRTQLAQAAAQVAADSDGSGAALAIILGVFGLLGLVAYKITKSMVVVPVVGGLMIIGGLVVVFSSK